MVRLFGTLGLLLALLPVHAHAGKPWTGGQNCQAMEQAFSTVNIDVGMACGNTFPPHIITQILYNMAYKNPGTPIETDVNASLPFVIGSTASPDVADPAVVGNAATPGTYLLWDNTTDNQFLTYSSSSSTWVNGWHKTTGGQDATAFFTFKYVADGSNPQVFFATKRTGTASQGVSLHITTAGKISFTQCCNAGQAAVTTTAGLTDGLNYVVGVSWHSGSPTLIWVGSATAESLAHTFKVTTTAPGGLLGIGVLSDGNFPLKTGTRLYDAVFFNEYFNNTKAVTAIGILEARNGIDFTP